MDSWNASPRNQAIRHAKMMMLANSTTQPPQNQQQTYEEKACFAQDTRNSPQRDCFGDHVGTPQRANSPSSPIRNVFGAPVASPTSANTPVSHQRYASGSPIGSPPSATSPVSPQRLQGKETIVVVSTEAFEVIFRSFSVLEMGYICIILL